MASFQTGALNSRPAALLPQQHFIGLYLKRNNGKYRPLFKKYHAQIYGAVKASLHVTTTAPHGGAVGLPPYYSHWIVDWLDTRAARTPCRTEPEHFSQLASNYATRRHHKLHVLQLNVRMSLLAILSHANPLYTLTPYFYYYYYYYY